MPSRRTLVWKRLRFVAAALCLALAGVSSRAAEPSTAAREVFDFRVLATGLDWPFEILWGPDDWLWITERAGKRVTRVRPSDGLKLEAITIPDVFYEKGAGDGLMGMALHPGLLRGRGEDFVYVAYVYDADRKHLERRAKIVRYDYDPRTQRLAHPVPLIAGLPASNDHNSGRLVFGPDGKLYYTIGDLGANQFENFCKFNRAQDLPTEAQVRAHDYSLYQGKILRLNPDGSIPSDNPTIAGVRSHVFAYGLRNAQGLAFGPNGLLYASDHGPKTDDEVNLIQAGKNYGWPRVAGFRDNKAYAYRPWAASVGVPCRSLTYSDYDVPVSVPVLKETDWNSPDFVPPLETFYTVDNGYRFRRPECADMEHDFLCWPTIAPSSLEVYAYGDGIPGWATSLLMTSLKHGAVYRLKLAPDGRAVSGEAVSYFKTTNRYRGLTISPDGKRIFVITDNGKAAIGPSGGDTTKLQNPGAILEFRYIGSR